MKTTQPIRALLGFATAALLVGATQLRADDRDDRIEDAFKSSHVYKSELRKTDLSVDAENGVVTLKGTVDNEDQRRLAEDTIRGLPGVVRVDNQVRITHEPKEASDDWIALKVRGALLFHRNVSATDTNVQVRDGVVTLTGIAKSDAEKALAAEYAADIKGVARVDNQLRVLDEAELKRQERARDEARAEARDARNNAADRRDLNERTDRGTVRNSDVDQNRRTMGERIDDASITAQLKSALGVRKSTSALKTEVTTEDGIVTIRGEARNGAEKDLVTKLAENIDGVRSVRNEMVVRDR
jgi:hyperosmotically inducible periplasmic protein